MRIILKIWKVWFASGAIHPRWISVINRALHGSGYLLPTQTAQTIDRSFGCTCNGYKGNSIRSLRCLISYLSGCKIPIKSSFHGLIRNTSHFLMIFWRGWCQEKKSSRRILWLYYDEQTEEYWSSSQQAGRGDTSKFIKLYPTKEYQINSTSSSCTHVHVHIILRARFGSVSTATLHSSMKPKYWFRIASTLKQYELQLKCSIWSLPHLWQKPWFKLDILHYETIILSFYHGNFSTLWWTCTIPWLSPCISLFLLASWNDTIHSPFSGLSHSDSKPENKSSSLETAV